MAQYDTVCSLVSSLFMTSMGTVSTSVNLLSHLHTLSHTGQGVTQSHIGGGGGGHIVNNNEVNGPMYAYQLGYPLDMWIARPTPAYSHRNNRWKNVILCIYSRPA